MLRSRAFGRAAGVLLALGAVVSMRGSAALSQQAGRQADQPEQSFEERAKALIAQKLPTLGARTRMSFVVYDLAAEKVLFEHDADVLLNSASNAKVATAAAALSLLGPDFRFRTGAYANRVRPDGTIAGSLYIRGRGDPSFGNEDLNELARQLELAGVKRITGGLVIDDGYFDDQILPPHFDEQPNEHASFRAPVGATSLTFNMVAVRVRPAPNGSGPAQIRVDPQNRYVRVQGRVQTVASGRTRVELKPRKGKNQLRIQVSGQIGKRASERIYRLRVPDPVQYFGSALIEALQARGIKVTKKTVTSGAVPESASAIAILVSPPLSTLIRGLGKFSNNYVAEMLLKTIGAETRAEGRPATWEDGLASVREFLAREVGLEVGSYRYENGSGLFSSNEFSSRQLVRILVAAYRDFRWGPDLVASFSLAGADGTLSARMAEGAGHRKVRAKTGTLARVSALSGYAAKDGRSPLAFSIILNDFAPKKLREARSLQDELAALMIESAPAGD